MPTGCLGMKALRARGPGEDIVGARLWELRCSASDAEMSDCCSSRLGSLNARTVVWHLFVMALVCLPSTFDKHPIGEFTMTMMKINYLDGQGHLRAVLVPCCLSGWPGTRWGCLGVIWVSRAILGLSWCRVVYLDGKGHLGAVLVPCSPLLRRFSHVHLCCFALATLATLTSVASL